jgi:hypothetical protein
VKLAAFVVALTLLPVPAHAAGKAAKVGWSIAIGAVAGYETWAQLTHHDTLTDSVRKSKKMKVAVGIGLSALTVHLYWK